MVRMPLCLVQHACHPSARWLPRCRQVLPGLAPLLDLMGQIAKRRGKTLSQVAINWAICQVGSAETVTVWVFKGRVRPMEAHWGRTFALGVWCT